MEKTTFHHAWKDPSRYQRFIAACKQIDAVVEAAVERQHLLTRRGDRSLRAGALYYLSAEFKLGVTANDVTVIFGVTPHTVVNVYQMINRALLYFYQKPWKDAFSLVEEAS